MHETTVKFSYLSLYYDQMFLYHPSRKPEKVKGYKNILTYAKNSKSIILISRVHCYFKIQRKTLSSAINDT